MTGVLSEPQIEGGGAFAANLRERRPSPLRHSLCDHPLLTAEAVAELAERLGSGAVVQETGAKPLVYTEDALAPTWSPRPGDAIRDLEANDSWLTLLNIERDPQYRSLVEQLVDGLAAAAGVPARRWRRRMGFVFASSPHSVTGAHFDTEHSLQLQLRGTRVLAFGEFADRATREREVSQYWHGSFGKLTTAPEPSGELVVEPGTGCYIPPYRPHWLHNGDDASLSLTLTFFNRDNERELLVRGFNERLRRWGRQPRPYGESPLADGVKAAAARSAASVSRLLPRPGADGATAAAR